MTVHATIAEAETRLAELLERAARGEALVIDREGLPSLQVRAWPLEPTPSSRRLGVFAHLDLPVDADAFLKPDAELAALVDERAAWLE